MNPESHQEFYFNLNNITSDSKYYTVPEFNTSFKNQSNMFSLLHVNSRSLNKNFESFDLEEFEEQSSSEDEDFEADDLDD